ncbi:restriction endonuclease [Candidatus Woesearchaeota archaeon]|nr:restriction endonuclease [Candidatus Woesearchaeota archaeon]
MGRNQEIGREFEELIAELFKKKGLRVKRNVLMERKNFKAEIDLIIRGIEEECYVECKYRKGVVDLEEVAKYVSVLESLNIDPARAIMVTNNDYTPRAKRYAQEKNLALYTLKELKKSLGVK